MQDGFKYSREHENQLINPFTCGPCSCHALQAVLSALVPCAAHAVLCRAMLCGACGIMCHTLSRASEDKYALQEVWWHERVCVCVCASRTTLNMSLEVTSPRRTHLLQVLLDGGGSYTPPSCAG